MTETVLLDLGRDSILTMLLLMAPPLAVALIVGVAISVLQAATQIQEMTLTFVPKIIAVFAALIILGPWMLTTTLAFAQRFFGSFAEVVR